MRNLMTGVKYLLDGFGLIVKPTLRIFVIIPLIINTIIFIGLFFLLRHWMSEFNHWLLNFLPLWLQWLRYILWIVFFLGFGVMIVYMFVMLANFVSAPFNSLLAEKVEMYLTNTIPENRSLMDNIKDMPRIFTRQLAILGYYLPRALVLFILLFVPAIHYLVPFLVFIFNAWFMTMTYMDYPTDNHKISIKKMHDWLRQHRDKSIGFGASTLILSMIPLVNCFIIPAAVAGATKFWITENSTGVK